MPLIVTDRAVRLSERRSHHEPSLNLESGVVFDFHEVFDEDYLYFYGPQLEESKHREVDLIGRLAALVSGAKLLDLACGHGRIANLLAQRGAEVSGLDASELFLSRAPQQATRAGIAVDYRQGDMRALPWADQSFDCVINWFTSFGYFDDADNRRVLSEIHRILRPGGRLLVENNNPVALLPRWLPAVFIERGEDFVLDRPRFDPVTGRATTERMVVRDRQTRRFTFSVRMFVAVELGDWLRRAGFERVDFYGPEAEPLSAGSRRMIALAHREQARGRAAATSLVLAVDRAPSQWA